MKRRDFLGSTLATGVGIPLIAGASIRPPVLPSSRPPDLQAFELDEATIASLQEGMASGRWTSRSITERYLSRIAAVDKAGPTLNSIIELNPDALSIADQLDRERREGKLRGRGALHGIPVLVKDNLDTGDRMATTAGSLALSGSTAQRDATVVERLRAAGAVLLGKTNLSEWANFRSTTSTSGWSGRGGLTKNPYILDRNACGSSSGSGSAAAANLAAITIGTETDGSIVCPASICGLVGIKPTVGLVSRAGIIPISATQDTAGPMCRTVADAAAVLAAIQGADPRDPATRAGTEHPLAGLTLARDALRGARLGIARQGFALPSSVEPVLAEAIAALKQEGAVIVDPAEIPGVAKLGDPEFDVLLYEFKAGIAEYLATRGSAVAMKTLADLIAFNTNAREKEMPWFAQEIFERAEKKGGLTTPAYRRALATCRGLSRGQGIDLVMARHRLDAIVAVTAGPSWPTDLVNGDRYTGGCSTPAAVAGYPHVTVPGGWVRGLPIGISFFGKAWSEARLIRFSYAFEQATRQRRPPQFLPTV